MSLFPFLAVLICTMGSLIVLLVVVVRQAQVQAATTAKEAVKEQQDKMKIAREMAQLRVSMMKNSKMREKTEADLAEARLKLGHVEDHSRQLREELTGLMKAWNELEESGNYENKNSEELAARLADIQARIVEADRRLKEVRDSAARKPRSFAIVPYQGAHETRRRPIYIECRENSVVLQPEGIVFTEEDFEGPLGPGNPLAAALRTVREHMLMREDFDPNNSTGETLEDSVEPYPLLLIRPGGIAAYYAARAAMKSWNAELGYELIDADWELEFQPPDPRLAELIGQEIKVARLRQRRLAAAAPRIHAGSRGGSHAGSRRREYTVSHGIGGVVPYGDTGDGYDDDDFGRGHGGAFGRYGGSPRNGGQYARGGSAGGNALRGTGDGSGFQSHGMTTPGENPYGGARDGSQSSGQSGSYLFGDGTGTGQGTDNHGSSRHAAGHGTASGQDAEGHAGTQGPRMGSAMGNFAGSETGGDVGDSTDRTNAAVGRHGFGTAGQGQATAGGSRFGGSHGGTGSAGSSAGASAGGSPHGAGSRSAGSQRSFGASGGQPSNSIGGAGESHSTSSRSLAITRGRNWGLPGETRGAVPITRPIDIRCHGDRIEIVGGRGLKPKTIHLGPRTEQSIDELVSTVWTHIESWGIAGRGMYWRPVLNVTVAPGAERRYGALGGLLDGSGLVVTRNNK